MNAPETKRPEITITINGDPLSGKTSIAALIAEMLEEYKIVKENTLTIKSQDGDFYIRKSNLHNANERENIIEYLKGKKITIVDYNGNPVGE